MADEIMPGRVPVCKTAHICRKCGAQYYPKRADRTTYCSRACYFANKTASAQTARAVGQIRDRVVHSVRRHKCVVCGARFTPRHATAERCSDACRMQGARDRARRANEAASSKAKCQCAECGASFRPAYGDKRRTYCSDLCSRRALRRSAKQLRRARMRGANAEAVKALTVFDRDAYRCGICGSMTLRAKRGTCHPRAPELDHILPLALGGEHTYQNTQCACRKCNIAKGSRPMGQIPLFAMG